MALPTTGQLSMSQVRTELGGSGAQSLSAAGVTLASITAGNQVALFGDLAGTSAGDSIVASFGSEFVTTNTSSNFVAYRTLNLSGLSTASIRPKFDAEGIIAGGVFIEYSINSTSLWSTLLSSGGSFSGTYTAGPIPGVSSGQALRIRFRGTNFFPYASNYFNITLISGSAGYTLVSGSVSSFTLTSPNTWSRIL